MKQLSGKITYLFSILIFYSATALANKNPDFYTPPTQSIPQAVITFDAHSSLLSESDKAALRNMVQDAGERSHFDQVTVAAWSDQSYADKLGTYPIEADHSLAMARADAISNYLRSNLSVTTQIYKYNMTENSNWIARSLRANDTELKSQFGKNGAALPLLPEGMQVIQEHGGPRQAIVIINKRGDGL